MDATYKTKVYWLVFVTYAEMSRILRRFQMIIWICFSNPWVLFSGVEISCWMSPSACRAQGVFGGEALPWSDFLSLCHRRHVAGLYMLNKVNWNSNHRLFNELPFASTRVRHTRAAAAAHLLEFELSRCRTSQFAKGFLPAKVRMWNYLACMII